jgi:hypothetical protein
MEATIMKARVLNYNPHQINSPSILASRSRLISRFSVQASTLLFLFLLSILPTWAWSGPYSIWNDAAVPAILSNADPNSTELGLKFRSAIDGYITGIRFYKGSDDPIYGNPGPHVGSLWTFSGDLLGSVLFQNETVSGWQHQTMGSPEPITANTTYVVSYHAPNGHYSADQAFFAASGVDSPPLRALADGEDGPNGVYAYSATSVFPTSTYNSVNYWVDVVMVPDTIPPTIHCSDVILVGANCDYSTSPDTIGWATVTDDFIDTATYKPAYSDSVKGVCPKVINRTWTAVDPSGNKASCVQTITCLPPNLVTDSGGCIFDVNPTSPDQDFGLTFSQGKKWTGYMLTGTVPGHFGYNVFYVGTPTTPAAFEVTLPSPFVTSGLNPIQAYDWVTVTGKPGQQCLKPGNEIFFSSQTIGLADFSPTTGSATVSVNITVPASGVVYLAIKLDYGLENYASGYKTDPYADAISTISGIPDIPNNGIYNFNALVNGSQIDLLGINIKNNNRFK